MVNVVVALLAALGAFGCAGLLIARTLPNRRVHLIAWSATLFTLGIGLGTMTVGFASGFSAGLLRTLELFAALLAPLTLVLGVVELVARTVQARFAARLIAASYVVVAVVIILLDPVIGTFGEDLPKVAGHYSSLPRLVLDGGHVFAVVSLVSCVAVTALRGNKRDRRAMETMFTVALVALAGVLLVTAVRGFLPGPLAPLALGGAVALIWFGSARVSPPDPGDDEDEEARSREDMSHHPGAHGRPPHDRRPYERPPVTRPSHDGQRHPQPSFAPLAQPMPTAQPPGRYGRITIYTLIEGHAAAFDRLAAEVTRAVQANEPGTLAYICHAVDNTANQRIFYQLFRDAAAVENHTRQPHVQRFAGEARSHVVGTNVIELTAGVGKITLPQDPGWPEAHWPGGRPPAPARGASHG